MEYWKVYWHHDLESEPTEFFSEIDDTGYEVRKVQKYRDGHTLRADNDHEGGDIWLSEIPVGPIEDVQAQAEFSAFLIVRDEFEEEWGRASWPRLR